MLSLAITPLLTSSLYYITPHLLIPVISSQPLTPQVIPFPGNSFIFFLVSILFSLVCDIYIDTYLRIIPLLCTYIHNYASRRWKFNKGWGPNENSRATSYEFESVCRYAMNADIPRVTVCFGNPLLEYANMEVSKVISRLRHGLLDHPERSHRITESQDNYWSLGLVEGGRQVLRYSRESV